MPRTITRTAIGAAAVIVALAAVPLPASASDHLDAPGLTSPGGSGQLDVNDLYAFQSPSNPDNAVIIGTFNPLAGVANPETLDPNAVYRFEIDTDGDALSDRSISALVDDPADGTQGLLVVSGDGSRLFPTFHAVTADGASGTATADGGWAATGVYDDPFFFDLNAFLGEEGRTFCDGGEFDFFAGINVTGVVLEVPRATIGGDAVGVWAAVHTGGEQVDRVGRPAINTVFIEGEAKNAYNAGQPVDDPADFGEALGDLAGVLLPDILTVDFSSNDGFLNGRLLADDVIDTELQVITGDDTAGDCVDANDVPFGSTAPYLAPAHSIEG